MKSTKLTREETLRLQKVAQSKDYEASIAILELHLFDAVDRLIKAPLDHRFIQGEIKALEGLREKIVRKE